MQPAEVPEAVKPPTGPAQIFLVHGHNDARKTEVARLLERTGSAEVVILHEQAEGGRTLIEKVEGHAFGSNFAVVLLTADDVGGTNADETYLPRARQNVVFELGFFFGSGGRARVAVLSDAGVEWPSDLIGLVPIELDAGGHWKNRLVRELREAGFDHDANKIV